MARQFEETSSQYLEHAGAVVTAVPFSIAAWFVRDNATNTGDILSICNNTVDVEYFRLVCRSSATGNTVLASHRTSSATTNAETTAVPTAGVWNHAAAVFASNSSRSAYLNGGNKGTETTANVTPSGLNRSAIGRLCRLNPQGYWDGLIAEVGVWNVALTDDDVYSLSRGVSPAMVRPGSLVGYWPLLGRHSPEPDPAGGFAMSLFSSPTFGDHCRIFYPAG